MKGLILLGPATFLLAGFGSYADIDSMSADEQTRIELKADQDYYGWDDYEAEVIHLPADDPRAKIPGSLLNDLKPVQEQREI